MSKKFEVSVIDHHHSYYIQIVIDEGQTVLLSVSKEIADNLVNADAKIITL